MKEAISMKIRKSCCNFEENRPNLIFCKSPVTFFCASINLVKVAFKVVEDEKKFRIGKNDFPKFDDVRVIQFLEALDFSQDVAVFYIFVFAFHFLDGDDFIVRGDSFEDNSKGPIAYSFNYLIFLHQTYLL